MPTLLQTALPQLSESELLDTLDALAYTLMTEVHRQAARPRARERAARAALLPCHAPHTQRAR